MHASSEIPVQVAELAACAALVKSSVIRAVPELLPL
jgi:hypothetical protein